MHTFIKEERLCNIKLIEKLFHNGSSFLVYPFRIVWLREEFPGIPPAQVLISVPKKRFKRAVDRNLLKRRIREIYRVQKDELLYPLLRSQQLKIILNITYIGNNISEYSEMEKKFMGAVSKLKKELESHVE